jgi:hypothetical protein
MVIELHLFDDLVVLFGSDLLIGYIPAIMIYVSRICACIDPFLPDLSDCVVMQALPYLHRWQSSCSKTYL